MSKYHEITLFNGRTFVAKCPRCGHRMMKSSMVRNRYSHYKRFLCNFCKESVYACIWVDPNAPDKRRHATRESYETHEGALNEYEESKRDATVHYGKITVSFSKEELQRLDEVLNEKNRKPRYTDIDIHTRDDDMVSDITSS